MTTDDGMRIAMIGSRGVPASSGGIEQVVERLGAALVRRGHDVTVFCRSNYVDHPDSHYKGMRLRVLPTIGTKHLDAIVHTALSTTSALRGYDVLHFHALGPGLLTPVPRLLARRTAVVQTVHALDWQRAKWGPLARQALKLGERLATSAPHAVTAPGAELVEYFGRTYGAELTLVPNPVEPIGHSPARTMQDRYGLESERYLLFVGRLTPEKRVDLLLRAFRRVETDLALAIVGGSSFTDNYVTHLHRLAAEDPRVVMTGELRGEALQELLTNACGLVNPSELEGSPSTVLEAISAGVPVIASAIPAHVELLGSAPGACQLHEVGQEDSLIASIERLADDRVGARREMALSRPQLLRGRSADEVAERTEAIYRQALARRHAR